MRVAAPYDVHGAVGGGDVRHRRVKRRSFRTRQLAYWTLVEDGEPHFMSTPFDVPRAVARISASDWPIRDEFVAENMLAVVSRDEAIAQFEAQR